MDFSNVVIQEDCPDVDGELAQLTGGGVEGSSPKAVPPILSEVSNEEPVYFLTIFSMTLVMDFSFSAGYAFLYKSSQTCDLGLIKARSKEELNHSVKSIRRKPSLTRTCQPCKFTSFNFPSPCKESV